DTVIDPIIGRLSDRIRTPIGRRHPFMYASALPAAGFLLVLWNLSPHLPKLVLAGSALLTMAAARISFSLYEIPSQALTPELSEGYDARTGLQSARWLFSILGMAAAPLLLNRVFLGGHAQGQLYREGYIRWAMLTAVVVVVAILVSALGTQRRARLLPTPPKPPRQTFGEAVREITGTVGNRSLLALMGSGFLGGCASGITVNLSLYMYLHFWGLQPKQYGVLLPLNAVGSLAAVFLAPSLARLLGKKRAMMSLFFASVAMGAGPVFLRLLGVMPPNGSVWIMPILGVDGIVTSTLGVVGFIIAGSMAADIVEDAAVRTGARSEGVVFAAFGLLFKFTGGVGAFIAGILLHQVHFPAHAERGAVDPALMRHLATLYLPITVTLNVIAISLLGLYRIDRRTHEENLATLRQAASMAEMAHTEQMSAGEGPAAVLPGV
ncbi:MAG TPA: MFS transporter, partial [Caulobacteraceae bacterium]|nr:MFS transporter [Caulobacteraceae bacterium]